jgi:hypothetical protein
MGYRRTDSELFLQGCYVPKDLLGKEGEVCERGEGGKSYKEKGR